MHRGRKRCACRAHTTHRLRARTERRLAVSVLTGAAVGAGRQPLRQAWRRPTRKSPPPVTGRQGRQAPNLPRRGGGGGGGGGEGRGGGRIGRGAPPAKPKRGTRRRLAGGSPPPADVEEHDLSGLSARPLSEAVELAGQRRARSLSISLDAWIHRYEASGQGLIELANVMVIAAGDAHLDPDRLDVEEQE